MFDVNAIRSEFPALSNKVYGKDLIYFDNAATSQRPRAVLELAGRMSVEANANIHRAVHRMADDATKLYEDARENVRKYINADSREEIIFTSGATAGFNLVATSFCDRFLERGDVVLLSAAEHHSNLVPWQFAAARKGASLRFIPVNDDGTLNLDNLDSLLEGPVKIVAVTQISNVLGIINPVEKIIEAAHSRSIPVLVDGAQGVVHTRPDVKKMDCDFYVFSGHKIFAMTGTGIVYGKRSLLEEIPPYMGGGDMVGRVTLERATYAPLPLKFEAGTPNFIGQATFSPALKMAENFITPEAVKYTEKLTGYMYDRLKAFPGLRLFGDDRHRIPLFSFAVDGVHHEDLALILDKMGIAVRTGMLCSEPLMDRFGVTGMVRASLLPYNTMEEVDRFMEALAKAVSMLS